MNYCGIPFFLIFISLWSYSCQQQQEPYMHEVNVYSQPHDDYKQYFNQRYNQKLTCRTVNQNTVSCTLDSSGSITQIDIQGTDVLFAENNLTLWFVLIQDNQDVWYYAINQQGILDTISLHKQRQTSLQHIPRSLGVQINSNVLYPSTSLSNSKLKLDTLYSEQSVLTIRKNEPTVYTILSSINSQTYLCEEQILNGDKHIETTWQNLISSIVQPCIHQDGTITTLEKLQDGYQVVSKQKNTILSECKIPPTYYEPIGIATLGDTVFVFFRSGVVVVSNQSIITTLLYTIPDVVQQNWNDCTFERVNNQLTIRHSTVDISFDVHKNSRWFIDWFLYVFLRYIIPLCVVGVILWIIRKALQYKAQVQSIVSSNESDIVFIVDSNLRLQKINSHARDLFAMDKGTPLRKFLRFYCNTHSHALIESFVSSSIQNRTSEQQKISIQYTTEEKEILFKSQTIKSITGAFTGVIITGVDITSELERKRLVNWAQLAHDMQTNLSIIKLNAEQLREDVDSERDKRKRILLQSSLLLQRVRDIVSLGRDEQLQLQECDIRMIFNDVICEFDDPSMAFIEFKNMENPFYVSIDKTKLLRAIRNAVENAMRAVNGSQVKISLYAYYESNHDRMHICIKDNGVGMDEQTRVNFLKPYFSNYRQYGGSGIGTMIMLRAAQIHNGTIEVQSEPSVGTTIIFNLPGIHYVRR